jgi:hypothetical protein
MTKQLHDLLEHRAVLRMSGHGAMNSFHRRKTRCGLENVGTHHLDPGWTIQSGNLFEPMSSQHRSSFEPMPIQRCEIDRMIRHRGKSIAFDSRKGQFTLIRGIAGWANYGDPSNPSPGFWASTIDNVNLTFKSSPRSQLMDAGARIVAGGALYPTPPVLDGSAAFA